MPSASKRLPSSLKPEDIMAAAESADYLGFCLDCGSEADGVEPDAEGYPCDVCGAHEVYGAEQCVILFI